MVQLVQHSREGIQDFVVQNFPHRKDQIAQAFAAHSTELYYTSIPTFLLLADGLWAASRGYSVFARDRNTGMPKAVEAMEEFQTLF